MKIQTPCGPSRIILHIFSAGVHDFKEVAQFSLGCFVAEHLVIGKEKSGLAISLKGQLHPQITIE